MRYHLVVLLLVSSLFAFGKTRTPGYYATGSTSGTGTSSGASTSSTTGSGGKVSAYDQQLNNIGTTEDQMIKNIDNGLPANSGMSDAQARGQTQDPTQANNSNSNSNSSSSPNSNANSNSNQDPNANNPAAVIAHICEAVCASAGQTLGSCGPNCVSQVITGKSAQSQNSGMDVLLPLLLSMGNDNSDVPAPAPDTFVPLPPAPAEKRCFTPETLLKMADGSSKRADAIRPGDTLWNPVSRKAARVRRVVQRPERLSLVELGFGDHRLRVTRSHPVLTASGMRLAGHLTRRDRIRDEQGRFHPLTVLRLLPLAEGQQVWNFEVEGETDRPDDHWLLSGGMVSGDLNRQQAGGAPLP